MKRIFTLASLIFACTAVGFAQGEMDAFNLSYGDLTGTARSVAMGGAFGALGGDVSGITINPAGIGIYKSYEIVTTLNFSNNSTKTKLSGIESKDNKFKFSFDNIAFVGVVPIASDEVPLINFGFSYNKLKSFHRKVKMNGDFMNSNDAVVNSLSTYIADRLSEANISKGEFNLGNRPFLKGSDHWYGAFAYNSYLVNGDGSNYTTNLATLANPNISNSLLMEEKGDISSYDFNVGTTISDIISIGATVSVTDINYHIKTSYAENWYEGNNPEAWGDYFFDNWLKTEGTGWQVKAGAIIKPIKELRLGVAYHSPTWYNMTDYYSALIDAINPDLVNDPNMKPNTPDGTYQIDSWQEAGEASYDYKLQTPDKWIFSIAGIIGQTAIISADYELTNYSRMTLKDADGHKQSFEKENNDIKADFRNSSTLRVGAEVRFTPQLSGRVGYMWQQSPVKDILKDGSANGSYTAATVGTIPNYTIVGDANYITYGLGYRFTPNFYADIAFVMKSRTDDIYNFGGADKGELKDNTFTGLLTLGCKF